MTIRRSHSLRSNGSNMLGLCHYSSPAKFESNFNSFHFYCVQCTVAWRFHYTELCEFYVMRHSFLIEFMCSWQKRRSRHQWKTSSLCIVVLLKQNKCRMHRVLYSAEYSVFAVYTSNRLWNTLYALCVCGEVDKIQYCIYACTRSIISKLIYVEENSNG